MLLPCEADKDSVEVRLRWTKDRGEVKDDDDDDDDEEEEEDAIVLGARRPKDDAWSKKDVMKMATIQKRCATMVTFKSRAVKEKETRRDLPFLSLRSKILFVFVKISSFLFLPPPELYL